MELLNSGKQCIKYLQIVQPGMLSPAVVQSMLQKQHVRHRQTKHWSPDFKRLRKLKFIKMELPNFQETAKDLPPEEMKKRMKRNGVLPPRPWLERPFHISCTGGIFEAYVPPEGDGKKSFISTAGAKQKFEFLEKKSKSMLAVRKIRTYEEDFDSDNFAILAQDLYTEAHNFMAMRDKHKIREFVTERCYPEMMHNVKDKTIHWKFLKSLEPPRMVHARVTDVIHKENLFAQVTVRFHTQQMLAIYDRFGRLMHGSEILAKDVLEYVVYEKHISNEYGKWRLHDKIIPDWLPPKQPAPITYKLIEDTEPEEVLIEAGSDKIEEGDKKLEAGTGANTAPQLPQITASSSASVESKHNATAI